MEDNLDIKFELLDSKFLFAHEGLYRMGEEEYYDNLVSKDLTVDGLGLGSLEYHNGMDLIYAFASTAYNSSHGCRLWVVIEAYEMFKDILADVKMQYEIAEAVFIEANGQEFLDSYFDDVDFDISIFDQFDWGDDEEGGLEFLETTQNYYHLSSVVSALKTNLEDLGVSYEFLQDAIMEGFRPSDD